MKKTLKHQSGYTIVELLVAIFVAAILTLSITQLISSSTHISQSSRDMVATTSFVENKIEALRSAGFNSPALAVGPPYTIPVSELPTELKGPPSGSYVVEAYFLSVKKVTITITYNDQGRDRTHSFAALIGELGVGQY